VATTSQDSRPEHHDTGDGTNGHRGGNIGPGDDVELHHL
jgi:hypothetical protein